MRLAGDGRPRGGSRSEILSKLDAEAQAEALAQAKAQIQAQAMALIDMRRQVSDQIQARQQAELALSQLKAELVQEKQLSAMWRKVSSAKRTPSAGRATGKASGSALSSELAVLRQRCRELEDEIKYLKAEVSALYFNTNELLRLSALGLVAQGVQQRECLTITRATTMGDLVGFLGGQPLDPKFGRGEVRCGLAEDDVSEPSSAPPGART